MPTTRFQNVKLYFGEIEQPEIQSDCLVCMQNLIVSVRKIVFYVGLAFCVCFCFYFFIRFTHLQ